MAFAALAQCPPSINCPANITVNNDPGQCSAVVNYSTPTGLDTCAPGIFTFTNCTATGRQGPSQGQANTAYASTSLSGMVHVVGGIQYWKAPATAVYRIEAVGAKGGGTNGGLGARMIGDFSLTAGQTIAIIVGQMGTELLASRYDWSGGGGSFVVDSATNAPLVVAGGGGGAGQSGPNADADTNTAGVGGGGGYSLGVGGVGGVGGTWVNQTSDGGAGLTGNGGSGNPSPAPQAFINGGGGGCNSWSSANCAPGGFGGGGSTNRNSTTFRAAGGGGGYSGGGAAYGNATSIPFAGGGGSINNGTNQANSKGYGTSHGTVIITGVGSIVPTTQTAGLPSGSQFPVGTTTNTFVTSNSAGSDTCSFTVTVNDTGQATVLGALSQDTICTSAGTLTLPAGTPAGGSYTGVGVTGNNFDPAVAQLGNHWIYYTDTVGCQNSDSVMITVVWCTGIEEGYLSQIVKIAPNPSNGLFQLSIPQGEYFDKLELFDASGRRIWRAVDPKNTTQLDLRNAADGLYMLNVGMRGQQQVFRLLKK